eukprot:RCo036671
MNDFRALLSPLVLLWGLLAIDLQVLILFTAKGKLSSYPFFLGIANYEHVLQLSSGVSSMKTDEEKSTHTLKSGIAVLNAVRAFSLRANLSYGNPEEAWFSTVKLGEISARFLKDWPTALVHFRRALELNSSRPDPLFHVGEHYRVQGLMKSALKYLRRAATMPVPMSTSPYVQGLLYNCLIRVELVRVALSPTLRDLSQEDFELVNASLLEAQHHCPSILAQELRFFH